MESLLSIGLGLGLSAACGFRVFVPLLALGLAARFGHVHPSPGFEWVSSPAALTALGAATAFEILAYYVPWLDHLLDTIATPAAVIAGVLASAAVLPDLPPALRWGVSLIGGGGAAGLMQGATVLLRLKSAALTGGVANPVVSTVELIGAVGTAVLAITLPLVCIVLVVIMFVAVFRAAGRLRFGRGATT
ncbi:MAG: DUF4126 domain-containing protein [Gemmatimonadota bacterium]